MKHYDLKANISTIYHDDHDVYFNMSGVSLGVDRFHIDMEGYSDFSLVLSKLFNDVVYLISSKVQAAIGSGLNDKLVPLINKVIDSIPSEFKIPDTDLHLDLSYSDQPTCLDNAYLSLPLYLDIESEAYPFDYPSVMQVYTPTPNDTQQVEVAVSEHLFDNVLYLVHKKGLIDFEEADNETQLSVSLLIYSLGNNFDGFNASSPCKFRLQSLDPFPDVILHE